ncbi:transmembrane protein, putative (macronuclear) [Tetrahymena thermophila SB210]|uniref:Transmembrane protein, putative n=1 Tax=Tetrahymena thermophila (strain SB210) TaxID=312017 RepID=Q22AM7_TETTS|nr:transmembrane protein, putative [Tetrahymena thermophila SB210]EAR82329.2 transmembrane protein, putative [Tetrahymena thermophila SB210]|eukprot:XP_001029992.2 transmembrane protein, putative [Tetrahymena thermophila SB210]
MRFIIKKYTLVASILLLKIFTTINAFKNCQITQLQVNQSLLQSLVANNLTISDQPFTYRQSYIFQVAVENVNYENIQKKNPETDRLKRPDPNKKAKYQLIEFEKVKDFYEKKNVFHFEDKKIIDIVDIEQYLVVALIQGSLRLININNSTLLEDQFETKVKDVQGIMNFKFRNQQYFGVYGRSLSVMMLKNGQLSNLYNETTQYENPIKNLIHSDGKIYYFTSKQIVIVNLLSQEIEKNIKFSDYQQGYLFWVFQNNLLIIPDNQGNSTSTYMLYDQNSPTKPQTQLKLRNEISSIKFAIQQYQGQILIKNQQNQIKAIEFDENNIQVRDLPDEAINIGIDYIQTYPPKQILSLSQSENGYNQYLCFQCESDKFLKVNNISPPICQQCGNKCLECKDEQKCTLCYQSYSPLNGICQCASKFVENVEKGICERYEEMDPAIKIIIISIVCVVIGMIIIIKVLQIRERKRIEQKQKLFKSTFKDNQEDDEIFNNDEDGEEDGNEEDEDQDEEKLRQNNVTALFDKKNLNKSLNSSDININNISMSKKAQKASQNKSFVKPKSQGKAVQLEDLEEQVKDRINTVNEGDNEDDDEEEEQKQQNELDDHDEYEEHEDEEHEDEEQEDNEDNQSDN